MARKKIVTVKDPALAAAERLWDRAHSAMLGWQQAIIDIITARAWEPIGYESFSKAWVERMADIELSAAVLPHVVYQFLSEGATVPEIADHVAGVGERTAERLKNQRDAGVPVEVASTRRKPAKAEVSAYTTLFVRLQRETLHTYRDLARKVGNETVEVIATQLLADYFSGL